MARNSSSGDSITAATRGQVDFSGHGNARGAAGVSAEHGFDALSGHNESKLIESPENGFGQIKLGLSWDNVITQKAGMLGKLIGKATKTGVDLDLGCFYELKNGERGALQAFGDMLGDYDNRPYICHSGDERTGDKEGDDEELLINGAHWSDIKRIVVYTYIYQGATDWQQIAPQITVNIPGGKAMHVTLGQTRDDLNVCAICGLENENGHIRIKNFSEYFPGHAEMDRAFGIGLEWEDGAK